MQTRVQPPLNKYIALFGFYQHGNFGDDLMAILFGKSLKSLGAPTRVFRLREDLANECGFSRAASIEELLENAAAVVYGGGGAFLVSNYPAFEKILHSLTDICSGNKIPIYMLSIGGENKSFEALSEARQTLLQSATYITFRNQEDQPLLDHIGCENGAIHHDVVWQTPKFYHQQRQPTSQFTIGIDNSLLLQRRGRYVVRVLMALCRGLQKNYRFVSFVQTPTEKRFDGFHGTIQYANGMSQFMEGLLQMDLIVTHRLHLLISAREMNHIPS